MSLKSFNESLTKAKRVQESAATVSQLTSDSRPKDTVYTFSSEGINVSQLATLLRKSSSPFTEVEVSGDTVRVISVNNIATAKILKGLGIVATIEGEVLIDKSASDPDVAAI